MRDSRHVLERQGAPAAGDAAFEADLEHGLTEQAAKELLAQHGPNALTEEKVGPLQRLLRYFWGPIPWMIEVAAALSLLLGDWGDVAIIAAMLLVNAGVGFWQENKAGNAIQLLKQRLAPSARHLARIEGPV